MKILNNVVVIIISFFSFCIYIYGLENIKVEGEDIFPTFDPNIKVYNVYTNKEEVNIILNLETNETTNNELNNIKLNKGLNKKDIIILKNNEEIKYTVNIYKDFTKSDNENEATLNNLIIENYEIDFEPNKYNYEIVLTEPVDHLNIKYTTFNPNAYVKVTGNSNFQIGDNKIKILVKSQNGKNIQEYSIKVNNSIPVSTTTDEILNDPLNIETVSPIKKIIITIAIIISSLLTIYYSYKIIFKKKILFG